MASKLAKISKKEANVKAEIPAATGKVNMEDLPEDYRAALAAEFKATISTLKVKKMWTNCITVQRKLFL